MAAVTADVPGVSLRRFSGSVASSAISTYRSRSIDTITPASSRLGAGFGPRQAEHGLRLVDGAVGRGQLAVLADPAAVEEPGRAVVPLSGVHLLARHRAAR